MADNKIYIPELNPVFFYETTRENLPKYFTKHFEKYMFSERLYEWQSVEDYQQIWQKEDIIELQFESTFNPIIAELIDKSGNVKITLPALIGMANEFLPRTFSFDVSMSLGSITESGCYAVQLTLGSAGPEQKILISPFMYISTTPINNSLCLEYWHSAKFHKDVIFATGKKFQFRVDGNFKMLEKPRKDEFYRDERYNGTLLSSRSSKVWPVCFGDEWGLPDDVFNLIDEIWSCDNVLIDGKPFGLSDTGKVEFIELDNNAEYPKRGVKYMVEEGINRNSKIFAVNTDTTKKLITTVIVEAKVFGDTSNQGSANTVPVHNIWE
jgi:hypothetical protein